MSLDSGYHLLISQVPRVGCLMKFCEDAGLKVPSLSEHTNNPWTIESRFIGLVLFLLLKQPVFMDFIEDLYIEGVNSFVRSNILMQVCIGLTQSHLVNHVSSSA